MTEPKLRATTEREEFLDPTEAQLRELFARIQRGDAQFFVLDALRDRSGHTYFQSTLNDDDELIIEHRAGSPDDHWGAVTGDLDVAHQVCIGWASERDGWQDLVTWTKVDLS